MRSKRLQTSICLLFSISALFLSASIVLAKEEILVDVDSDAGLNTAQIIQARGYEVELHKITTADGYVLTMHRIPKSYDETQSGSAAAANKPVVVLQHGLLDSSYTWVLNYRDQSLAFILADLGYDVWLGNNRGTTWSKEHKEYSTDDERFWDFTWEDMGKYDLPAMIKGALSVSGRSTLSYVGHSEGTTQAFVGFTHDQELAKSVSYFGALTPVAWTGDATSPIFVTLAKTYMDTWLQAFGGKEFLPNNPLLQNLLGSTVCAWADETPAGTSAKNVGHYAQGIRDNTFASYDYGCNCDPSAGIDACSEFDCGNKAKYGSFQPPAFPIQKMVYPRTGFYSGARDTLATQADINKLRAGLPRGTIVFDKTVDFGHIDFTWAYNAHENVYNDLIQQIQQYEGKGY
ncbi:putative lipase [Phytophthora cinnamomi]|uniref:putative lipase n=1 Tax=Phytophthora cinnamomi TaxID=4785 RepID=UPI003559E32B|nr:putative lipase [Phytophthora cinnamomi]